MSSNPTIPAPDPLLGFSPDDIVVGPGGQTMAQAAAEQVGAGQTLAAHLPVTELVRLACDIATGAVVDPAANSIRCRGAWRDLNAKGDGGEIYRRALTPGGAWRFVSSDRLPRGTFLASDRKASIHGDVYVGDLLADYGRSLRRGASDGEARHDGKIGLVIVATDKGPEIEWMDVVRQKDGTWRVILPSGAHLTFAPANWR